MAPSLRHRHRAAGALASVARLALLALALAGVVLAPVERAMADDGPALSLIRDTEI